MTTTTQSIREYLEQHHALREGESFAIVIGTQYHLHASAVVRGRSIPLACEESAVIEAVRLAGGEVRGETVPMIGGGRIDHRWIDSPAGAGRALVVTEDRAIWQAPQTEDVPAAVSFDQIIDALGDVRA